jgi:predicted glycogen debranching enzyme
LDALTSQEWLEADGLGGFASGTASGVRTRRYHALLQVATTPPTNRMTLVNGFDAWVETPAGRFALSSQRYAPDVTFPDGAERLDAFDLKVFPTWTYLLPDGTRVRQELFVPKGSPAVVLCWTLIDARPGALVTLQVRPFLSGRDQNAIHRENDAFRFKQIQIDSRVIWQPYPGVPPVCAISNGVYAHDPRWYRNFFYELENERGLDAIEDLGSPGEFTWNLGAGTATLIFNAEGVPGRPLPDSSSPLAMLASLRKSELARRKKFSSPLHKSADAYLVKRGDGQTVIAGYPWFTDWGRDTFISLRGLCLTGERLADAGDILMEWAGAVSEGMLPNLFPDGPATPEYNSIDASLWYVVAVHEYLAAMKRKRRVVPKPRRTALTDAIDAILTGYKRGTRFGIRMDSDALITGGAPGVALTWMDARIDGEPVTPRRGKPVEIQALWLNALQIGGVFSKQWNALFKQAAVAFETKFWNEARGFLNDVVDADFVAGAIDASLRPNQIFAIGGLPFPILRGERARRVVDRVEEKLWTPLGLRSLSPDEPGYVRRYDGDQAARDRAYHQGTVWPWLSGAFVEAWLSVRKPTVSVRKEARHRFLSPLLTHLEHAGLGHVSEIADATAPFTPRGCPFQAWSTAELIRLQENILKEPQR